MKRTANCNSSLCSKFMSCRALNSLSVLITLVCILALLGVAFIALPTVHAANPNSGSISLSSAPISWQGTAVAGGAIGDPLLGLITSEDMCIEGTTCDTYTLTINGTPSDWINAKKIVHVHLGWTIPTQDFDLYIHKGDLSGPVVANSGNGATNGVLTSEDADLDPSSPTIGTGTFAVHVVYWVATAAEQYTGTASVTDVPAPGTSHVSTETAPRFFNYADPYNDEWGEPSLGVNWKSGNVMFISALATLRIGFDERTSPAGVNWAD